MKYLILPFLLLSNTHLLAQSAPHFKAKQFATLDGNLLFFTPGEEDPLQMDFIELVSQKIKNEGFPISDRAFIEIDSIEVFPEELDDYQPHSVQRLKKQSDAAFWRQLSGGAFMYRDDDQQLQLFEIGSPHRAVSANYRPLALSLRNFSEADEPARFIQQNEPLLFHDGFQQWLTGDYETYTVVLLHLNKNIPFALLFDEKDGEYCGYIIVTSEGPQLGLADRCTGVNCGWKFVKMPQPQYAKWALRENWRLSEQFDTLQNGAYLSVQNARTGQILVQSAKSVDMYPSCLAVQLPDGQYHLYDGLGRLVYPRDKNDPVIRALDARWASGAGIRVLIGNQFYWWTLTGGIRADEHPPLPVVEVCGTVDYYTDSLVQTAGQWEIRCHREGTATAGRSETYVLPAQSDDQIAYVNYTFLNGEPVFKYTFGSYWGGDFGASLYQPVVARRADQRYDLLRLETGPNRLLQKTILLEKADWVQNMGYNALLLFKKNGLLGVFPGMTEGKFAEIQPFEYFFARITMPNGRKGWVNMEGETYLDK